MIEFIRLSMYPVSGERGKLRFAPLFSCNSEDPARGGTLCSHRAQHRKGSDPGQ